MNDTTDEKQNPSPIAPEAGGASTGPPAPPSPPAVSAASGGPDPPRSNGPEEGNGIAIVDMSDRDRSSVALVEVPIGGPMSVAEAMVPIINFPKKLTGLNRSDYATVVRNIREMYAREGLIANFIDMMKELNAAGAVVKTKRGYKALFDTFHSDVNSGMIDKQPGIDAVRRKFDHGLWTAGMVCVLFRTEARMVKLGQGSAPRKFIYPVEMTFIDPLLLNLDEIYTTGNIYYEADKKWTDAIVKNPAGPEKHWFIQLYPAGARKPNDPANLIRRDEILDLLVKKKRTRIPLPIGSIRLDRLTNDDSEIYPTPYLVRCFDPVNDKRLLVNTNRSLLTKSINAILHVMVSSGKPGILPSDPYLASIRDGQQSKLTSDPSRMQVHVTGDNITYKWVTIPPDAILQQEHYRVSNYEILASALGLVANMLLSDNGTIDMELINQALQGKNDLVTQRFSKFMAEIYDNVIIKGNKLEQKIPLGSVHIRSRRISTYQTDAFRTFIHNGVKLGALPAQTFIDEVGEDYDAVVEQLKEEQKLREEYKIFIGFPGFNQVFTQISADGDTTMEQNVSTPSEGRPPGTSPDGAGTDNPPPPDGQD